MSYDLDSCTPSDRHKSAAKAVPNAGQPAPNHLVPSPPNSQESVTGDGIEKCFGNFCQFTQPSGNASFPVGAWHSLFFMENAMKTVTYKGNLVVISLKGYGEFSALNTAMNALSASNALNIQDVLNAGFTRHN